MSSKPTNFFWYELLSNDTAAAGAFYAAVVGWKTQTFGDAGMPYTILEADGRGVGGMISLAEVCEADAQPGWIGYIRVDDTDVAVERIKAAGGQLRRGPEDIPTVGRFAVVGDPQGAGFNLLAPDGPDMPPVPAKTPGHVGWHELYARDGAAIFDFYAGQFGWTKGEPFDMGDMGVYQLFAAGGDDIGGIMTKPPFIPVPVWLFYFTVDGGIEAAAARVTEHGGKIINGPMEVPSSDWIVQCTDPEGVMFALVSDRK